MGSVCTGVAGVAGCVQGRLVCFVLLASHELLGSNCSRDRPRSSATNRGETLVLGCRLWRTGSWAVVAHPMASGSCLWEMERICALRSEQRGHVMMSFTPALAVERGSASEIFGSQCCRAAPALRCRPRTHILPSAPGFITCENMRKRAPRRVPMRKDAISREIARMCTSDPRATRRASRSYRAGSADRGVRGALRSCG